LGKKANTSDLKAVATTGSYNDLSDKPSLGSLASKSQITNADVATNAAISASKISGLANVAISGSYNDLSNKPTLFDGTYSSLSGKPNLATVATSGSYNDLSNKPTIPAAVTVVNSLTSTSTTSALSAAQGKALNDRLTSLGFRSGTVSLAGGTASVNYVYRQGNYVYGKVQTNNTSAVMDYGGSGSTIFTIPSNFRPKTAMTSRVEFHAYTTSGPVYTSAKLTINTNGTVVCSDFRTSITRVYNYEINFGYEANPIT
jgi:hypothetical protein